MVSTPYPISGVISDNDGSTVLQSTLVTLRNLTTNEYLTQANSSVTNSLGEYTVDAANTASGYTNGDNIEILVYRQKGDQTNFEVYQTIIDTSLGSESRNITTRRVTYTNPIKISKFLQLRNPFQVVPATGTTAALSLVDICDMIFEAEDYIDGYTRHAWRRRYSGTSSGKETSANFEYYDPPSFWFEWMVGIPIYLAHRKLETLSSSLGDVIEIWDGSNYQDWITTKTEDRARDFWVDYEMGILYIRTRFSFLSDVRIRVKYRYGEASVDGRVQEAAIKLVAIRLITNEDMAVLIPEGADKVNMESKASIWQTRVNETLSSLSELQVMKATW